MTNQLPATATVADLEALRGPLTGYCYRLLGSAADTEGAVQETIVRAAARLEQFDPARARLTTWVHRIATNICLDMLRAASRRALPVDLSPAATVATGGDPFEAPLPAERFVEPMPDSRLWATGEPGTADPGHVVEQRETVRLAFIAALQYLTPRQRAALVLREVLSFSAAETAEILQVSTAAANSALQRARATIAAASPGPEQAPDPQDPAQQRLLGSFVDAFESHDVDAMVRVLRADAIQTMPPVPWMVAGDEFPDPGTYKKAQHQTLCRGPPITMTTGELAAHAEARLGEGTPTRLPARDILLIATGRKPL